jgi:hypothetical protein
MNPYSLVAANCLATAILAGCQNSVLTGPPAAPTSDTQNHPAADNGDGGPEHPANQGQGPSCIDLVQAWQMSIATLASAPGSCAVDDDCTLVTEQVACNDHPGIQLEECPVVVTSLMAQSVSQQLSDFRNAYCAGHCASGASAQCKPITAGCVKGVCRGVESGPPDAAAGTQPPTSNGLSCSQIVQDFRQTVSDLAATPGSCTTDADCIVVTPKLTCGASRPAIEECPMAASSAVAASLATKTLEFSDDFCAAQCNVGSASQCKSATAQCVNSECQTITK